jgi:hypothetical protein
MAPAYFGDSQITDSLQHHYNPRTDRRTVIVAVMSHNAATTGAWPLSRRQLWNGRVDCLDPRAGNFDAVVFAEVPPNGGVSQARLPVHEACGRTAEFGGKMNHRRRIFACAVLKVGCDSSRAD